MSNLNLNKVILGGRLTGDPELRTTPAGVAVTSFTVAINRRFSRNEESQADFINVTAWRATAEFITKYFRKGSSICVVGSIQTRKWTDAQGANRYATDVVADEVMFVDSKNEGPAVPGSQPTSFADNGPAFSEPASYNTDSADSAPDFAALTEDDELPF